MSKATPAPISEVGTEGLRDVESPISDIDCAPSHHLQSEAEDYYPRPSSERYRSSSADSTRFSFVAMDQEAEISPTFSAVVWSIPCVLVIIAATVASVYGDVNASTGFSRDVMTYTGSSLSIVGAFAVFISDKYMTHWKLHPNPLIYWKMVADFLLAVVALSSQASNHPPDSTAGGNDFTNVEDCNISVAGWVQFCLLSSETWFFVMALDLFFSLRNPFTSYKKKYPRYHIVCWGMAFISMTILTSNGLAGTSTADICWVKDDAYKNVDGDFNNVWVRNR